MNKKKNLPAMPAEERIAAIQKQRSAIMALKTEEKAQAILNADHPAAMVHAFPEQDFLLLVEEVGPDDAMELIALASMLRIPVGLHNVPDERIFRPSAWAQFGAMDKQGADFRACAAYGPLYR